MFKKLVSNLPFNPSLMSQVSFYTRRMQEEATIRRMGFGLIALAMFIQMFAVIAPPEKSLAASDNHIINGLKTKNDILAAWYRKGSDIPSIYGKFGLTKADIEKLPMTPNTTIVSSATGKDYWTIGRNSLTNYGNVKNQYKVSEIALNTGPTTVYMRDLKAWNIINAQNSYKAFTGKKADGTQFWILLDCGNYTQIGKYAPKTPQLEIRKSIVGGVTTLKAGDTFTFRIEYRNRIPDSLADNVIVQDQFDLANYDIVNTNGLLMINDRLRQGVGNLSYSSNFKILDIKVRLKNPFPGTTGKTCNVAKIVATNAVDAQSGPACVTVKTLCQINPNDVSCKPAQPKPITPPTLYCSITDTNLDKTKREATLKTTVTSTNEAITGIYGYNYEFGDRSKLVTQASTKFTDTIKHVYPVGDFTTKVTVVYGYGANGKQEVSCTTPINFDEEKPFGEMKTVKNITQKLEGAAAVGKTVNAGDVLEYTLTTSNTQDFERKNHTVVDYVGDILDYAKIDESFLKEHGGTFDPTTKKVSFVVASLPASSDITSSFRVTLKNPIPATNTPSTVSGTFDCKISNKYGNELTLGVNCPAVKGLETLPNTGPGTSVIMGFTLTMIVGYFFARSRLIAKELAIIKADYTQAGGM
jgi:hypothetical protein